MPKYKKSQDEKFSHHEYSSKQNIKPTSRNKDNFKNRSKDEKEANEPGTSGSKLIFLKYTNPNFPWMEYRSTLNKIFFHDRGRLKRLDFFPFNYILVFR